MADERSASQNTPVYKKEEKEGFVAVAAAQPIELGSETVAGLDRWSAMQLEEGRWSFTHRDYDNGATSLYRFQVREVDQQVTVSFELQNSTIRVSGSFGRATGYQIQNRDGQSCVVFIGEGGSQLEVRNSGGMVARSIRNLLIYPLGPPWVRT